MYESTLVKIPNFWKSHAAAQLESSFTYYFLISNVLIFLLIHPAKFSSNQTYGKGENVF